MTGSAKGILLAMGLAGAAVAGGAYFYLSKTAEVVERTLTPITVSAPDLFPADTRMFVALHGIDGDYAAMDAWRKRIEPTVMWRQLSALWGPGGPMGRQMAPAMKEFDTAMDEAESRLGYRPTTEQFFQVYGRFTAFGLVPAADGGKPGFLGVVKLPDDGAVSLLESKLGGHAKVKRRDGLLRGFPAYEEEFAPGRKRFYGVGGAHLFIADALPALESSLARMEALQAKSRGESPEGAAPLPSLSSVAEFRAAAGEDWTGVRAAMFMRKDAEFHLLDPSLEGLDALTRGAFVHAPGADCMAMAVLRNASGELSLRSSLPTRVRAVEDWESRLPAGLVTAVLNRAVPASEAGPPQVEAFRRFKEKAIWKEAADLLRSPERLRTLITEAAGEQAIPEDDTLERLSRDVDLVEAVFDSIAAESGRLSTPAVAMISKVYGGENTGVQQAFGGEAEISWLVASAAGLEAAREKLAVHIGEGNFQLEKRGESLVWIFHLDRILRKSLGEDVPEELIGFYGNMGPAIVQADGCMWFCMGHDLARELADCGSGKVPLLSSDPLWRECMDGLPADPVTVEYSRPAESLRAQWEGSRGILTATLDQAPMELEVREVIQAVLAGMDRAMRWSGDQRAVMWASYPGSADEGRGLVLTTKPADGVPSLLGANHALRTPDLFPDSCFWLVEGSLSSRPLFEDFMEGALSSLTDGERRWAEFRSRLRKENGGEAGRVLDGVETMLREVEGEFGLAVMAPFGAATEPSPPDPRAILDRLPGMCFFATYEDGGRAFDAASTHMEMLQQGASEMLGPDSFERRVQAWRTFQGPFPVGVSFFRDRESEFPAAALRIQFPADRRGPVLDYELGLVQRGNTLLWCNGLALFKHLRSTAPSDGMGARLRADAGADGLPREVLGFSASRSDGMADVMKPFWGMVSFVGPQLSMGGFRQQPPPERVAAHEAGWQRVAELLDDLLRPGTWHVTWSVRDGDRIPARARRFPVTPR